MENLLTEIKVMKQLQHEHIVQLSEFEVSCVAKEISLLKPRLDPAGIFWHPKHLAEPVYGSSVSLEEILQLRFQSV